MLQMVGVALAQYSNGNNAFTYLNQLNNARAAAVGGRLYAINDKDICLTLDQPALVNTSQALQFHSNYNLKCQQKSN